MSEPHQSLEEHLFEVALTKASAAERAAFLDGVCRDNPGLRARLEVLLEGHFQAEGFLTGGTKMVEPKPAAPPTEPPSERIGRYKLLQPIGEGGCGVVYMAEQEEPVRRRIALKVIKLGMDTKSVIARFEAERQALAMMDHPNIAKVLDAGATDTGRPYFVMELVRGKKVTDYCDEHDLSTKERLELFIQVCHAVQHAHQKGIIHRDLKPSNILVASNDGVPVPKVIDFGIAKATQGRLTDQTLFTAFEQFIGTPAYMSPEQAELTMQDVDTRTDIYSLGVLLYELLTGDTPFDAQQLLASGLDAMRRTIREVEPVKPSTRLTQELVAAGGKRPRPKPETPDSKPAQKLRASSRRLLQEVRGDLDWIVMKCLEKDRARRYETANAIALDVQHHLADEPVAARPPGKLYRFQKLVRRNKLVFAATGAVIIGLTLGLCVATWALVRERAARRETEATRDLKLRAESTRNEFLSRFLFGSINIQSDSTTKSVGNEQLSNFLGTIRWRARDPTLARVGADFFSARVAEELTNQPATQGDMWLGAAAFCADMRDYPRAVTNCQRAVTAYRLAFGADHPKFALALVRLGRFQSMNTDVSAGRANAQLAVATARKSGDTETLALCLLEAGKSLNESGEPTAESIPFLREAMHLRRDVVPNLLAYLDSTRSLEKAIHALALEGKVDEAKVILQEELRESPSEADLLELQQILQIERPEVIGNSSKPTSLLDHSADKPSSDSFSREELSQKIPHRDPATSTNLIDLSFFYNAPLTERWHGPGSSDLSALPREIQTFAGVEFDVRGLIQLAGISRYGHTRYPYEVRDIPVHRACRRLHFLHAAILGFDAPDGAKIGSYVIHYAFGTQSELPIIMGETLGDWWDQPHEEHKTFTVAWVGQNLESRKLGRNIRLFKTTWANPAPGDTVNSIDFGAFQEAPAPFLVAITIEP